MLTDSLKLLADVRPDIIKFDQYVTDNWNKNDLLEWLITSGLKEYSLLSQDIRVLKLISFFASQQTSRNGIGIIENIVWKSRKDVQGLFPLPTHIGMFYKWFITHGLFEHRLERLYFENFIDVPKNLHGNEDIFWSKFIDYSDRSSQQISKKPFGVNLIGFHSRSSGIAEDCRTTREALESTKIPVNVIDLDQDTIASRHGDVHEKELPTNQRYFCNVFCLTAQETARFALEYGMDAISGFYNIGYWPWELENWPAAWMEHIKLTDEIWCSSYFIYTALDMIAKNKLHLMPLVVRPAPRIRASLLAKTRRRFNIAMQNYVFYFNFDANSFISRKNPEAIIDAFELAFPVVANMKPSPMLLLKALPPIFPNSSWDRLKARIKENSAILLLEEDMDICDLSALVKSCDCFVSLHRSEGFGRCIAEALQLGQPVIVTNYGGNIDFCQLKELSHLVSLVDYDMIPVGSAEYIYGQGNFWANPNVYEAATFMQVAYKKGRFTANVPNDGWPPFRSKIIAREMKSRLKSAFISYADKTNPRSV